MFPGEPLPADDARPLQRWLNVVGAIAGDSLSGNLDPLELPLRPFYLFRYRRRIVFRAGPE